MTTEAPEEVDDSTFGGQLYLDVLNEAQAHGIGKNEAFFDVVTDYLVEEGILSDALHTYYARNMLGFNARVDGYCGDPKANADALGIDKQTLGLIVVDFDQVPNPGTLTERAMTADFKRAEEFLKLALTPTFLVALEQTSPVYELADIISNHWNDIERVEILLLTDKSLSSRVRGKTRGEFEGREIVYNVWDINRLAQLAASGKEREPLVVDFRSLPGGPMRALLASNPGEKRQVYLTAVPGEDLACVYDEWGARLLEQNVRVFLQARSKVNKGIKRTLEEEPELFFSFNNGITATAERVETEQTADGLVITELENLQIVNGGQTTASVYAALKNKKDLSKVFVQMKLSVLPPEEAQVLVPRISEYANTQNRVSQADFFANHPYHVRIENLSKRVLAPASDESFSQTKWFYERARGAYQDAQAYLTPAAKKKFVTEYPKDQKFTKTDLAKYLMVWTDRPYVVNLGAQKNFAKFADLISDTWEKDQNQFNEVYFKQVVAKKIIFNAAEKAVQSRDWYQAGGYRAQHVALTVGFLAQAVRSMGKEINFGAVWAKQDTTEPLEKALGVAADCAHEVLMDPDRGSRNVTEWAKKPACWDKLKSMTPEWPEDFVRSLVSKGEHREQLAEGRKVQKEISGIEAQKKVVEAGPGFWQAVLAWCTRENEGTEKERGILQYAATQSASKVPSDKQALVLLDLLERLQKDGCPLSLEKRSRGRGRRASRG